MWITQHEQYTSRWHQITVNIQFDLHRLIEWFGTYESQNGGVYVKRINPGVFMFKFKSQEDMVMFMFKWLDN